MVWESIATRERKLAAKEKARNPIPGLSSTIRRRIDRTLHEINDVLFYWLHETDHRMMRGWLPYEDIITTMNDEMQYEWSELYNAAGKCDPKTGLLTTMNDDCIKATNRISVATWYETEDEEHSFFMVRYVFSPLPHPEWGRLPLTVRQWQIISLAMIGSRICWQWLPGLIDYTQNPGYEKGKQHIVGWHMEPTIKTSEDSTEGKIWTGQAILQQIISHFSLD